MSTEDADTAVHIPDTVTIDGLDWPVRRAWPASRGRIAWEAVHPSHGIRVGYLDEQRVRVLDAARDPKLPGLTGQLERGGRLVSHRPGKRAVVRLPDGTFAKCVRDGRASDVIAGQRRAAGFLPGFTLPQVLRSDTSTVVLSGVPGVELHDPAELGGNWSRAWAESLGAWAKATPPTATMPVHDAAAEADVLRTWRDRVRSVLGADSVPWTGARRTATDRTSTDRTGTDRTARRRTGTDRTDTDRAGTDLEAIDELIAEVTNELTAGAAAEPDGQATVERNGGAASARDGSFGLIHRDLHDKQIMWDPVAGPGLLDVDTACMGERALDLGNLLAHARWRTDQGLWTPAEAAVVIEEIARVASAIGIDPGRVSVYERATLIRLACVYAFRPRWRDHTGALLDAVEASWSEAVGRQASTR